MDQDEYNLSLMRELYANWNGHNLRWNQGLIRNNHVQFLIEASNEFLGAPNYDHSKFQSIIEQPPYHDIRHTLLGVNSVARCNRVRDMGQHSALHYAHF